MPQEVAEIVSAELPLSFRMAAILRFFQFSLELPGRTFKDNLVEQELQFLSQVLCHKFCHQFTT
jgi:hypothetical protein